MNCDEVLSRAYDYFEHALSPDERALVDRHVAGCPRCGELFAKAREMSCRDFSAGCGELVDGTAADERRRLFERHLSICRACVAYLESYERTLKLAKSAHSIGAEQLEALEERLVDAILAARKQRG